MRVLFGISMTLATIAVGIFWLIGGTNVASQTAPIKVPHVLVCSAYLPPSVAGVASQTDCISSPSLFSTFPYTVPAGQRFCVQSMAMVNKFPWQPEYYGNGMRTTYFLIPGWSAPAHHPEYHFVPPMRFDQGEQVFAYWLNGIPEGQNAIARIGGYLTGMVNPCD